MTFRISLIGLALAMAPFVPLSAWGQSPFESRYEVKEDSELRQAENEEEETEEDESENTGESQGPERGEEGGERRGDDGQHLPRVRPTEDPAQRLHHIRMAIEHLQAAGLPQEAERASAIAHKIERELIGVQHEATPDERTEMREFGRILRMMHRSLRELRIAVQELNSRVEALESEAPTRE